MMLAAGGIRRLDQPVADAIAAGEVVERPASVVKELCENALDAGALRIDVDIDGGGITRIRVADNGGGIPAGELDLAVARHATSKIASADDLDRIATLGFRGEALASIAAVSELSITSRRANEEAGAVIRVRGGMPGDVRPAAAEPGTVTEVCDLFITTPARLRFLRSAKTETGAATRVVSDLALAHPEVAFTCRLDGRIALRTPGGSLREALAAVYGTQTARELMDVDAPGDIAVAGAISEPRAHRAGRNQVVLIINGRRIHHRGLTVAIEDAYRGLLPGGRYPFGVVAATVDPPDVDINVHPAKREVRFRDERAVFNSVQRACWHALQGSQPYAATLGWSAAGAGVLSVTGVEDSGTAGRAASPLLPWPEQPPSVPQPARPAPMATYPELRSEAGGDPGTIPAMRAIGQAGSAWLVADAGGGVVLVDPHAAHEKVLYSELMARWSDASDVEGPSQMLLIPALVECDPRRMARALAGGDVLSRAGFRLDEFGPGTVRCTAVPAVAAGTDAARLVADVLDQLDGEDGPVQERWHRIAALVACHAAVRFGDTIAPAEQQRLLDRMTETPGALTCPHGRPTLMTLDDAALRRAFRRPSG